MVCDRIVEDASAQQRSAIERRLRDQSFGHRASATSRSSSHRAAGRALVNLLPAGQRPLVLTMGEPAGIGGEIALKAWLARDNGLPLFFLVDDAARLRALAGDLGLRVPVRTISGADDAITVLAEALPVLDRPLPRPARPGEPDPANAAAVTDAIETAVTLVRSGPASAVVTNPIYKKVLYDAGFRFPGHTEYLAALAGDGCRPVMMLACAALRGGAGHGTRRPETGGRDAADGRHRRQRKRDPRRAAR